MISEGNTLIPSHFLSRYGRRNDLCQSLVPETVSAGIPQFSLLRTAGTPFEYIEEFFRTGVKEAERRLPNYEAAIIGNTVTLLTHITRAFLAQGTKHSRNHIRYDLETQHGQDQKQNSCKADMEICKCKH
jgi:hypothetical protein